MKMGVVEHASDLVLKEVCREAEGHYIQGLLYLFSEFEVILDFRRACFKNKQANKQNPSTKQNIK